MSTPTVAERLHSGSALNSAYFPNARAPLAARVAELQAERDSLLTETAEAAATWQPSLYAGQAIGRSADLANAARRLAELDRQIAEATAEVDALDEIRDAYDAILNPPE